MLFFFSSRRRHTRCLSDWSSDVCSSDLSASPPAEPPARGRGNAGPLRSSSPAVSGWASRSRAQSAARYPAALHAGARSEERRVGKECRGGWAREQERKNE